jgi:hypothetical protein
MTIQYECYRKQGTIALLLSRWRKSREIPSAKAALERLKAAQREDRAEFERDKDERYQVNRAGCRRLGR